MRGAILAKALLLWLALFVVAFVGGALRELLLVPAMGSLPAEQLETVMVAGVVLALCFVFIPPMAPSLTEAKWIGVLWVALTVGFEFGFFHYVMGRPWSLLLAAYDVTRGRLWPLFLLVVLLAPYLAAKMQKKL
jgi:hypothetical protein